MRRRGHRAGCRMPTLRMRAFLLAILPVFHLHALACRSLHMGIALLALSSLCQPLRRIAGSMRPRPAPSAHHSLPDHAHAIYPVDARASNDPQCAAIGSYGAPQTDATNAAQTPAVAASRPLRVILNRNDGRACRLVISGRMADVCAELNRLALH